MSQPQQSSLTAQQRLNKRGVSLMELLVVMGLMGVISTILIAILSQSSSLVSQGATKIQLHQKTRSAIERISPYVATAVAGGGTSALDSPNEKHAAPTAADMLSYKSLKFTSTEDFLNPDYDPSKLPDVGTGGAGFQGWAVGDPVHHFEITFDDSKGTDYVTQARKDPITGVAIPAGTLKLGQIIMRELDASNNVLTKYPNKILAHNVQRFNCYLITSNSVEVEVFSVGQRKGPQGNMLDVYEKESAIIPVPSASY